MFPAGMLNRSRLCVPARTLWGALTAELARRQTNGHPDYDRIGKDLQQQARFTYLFPAEQVNSRWCAWLPCYQEGQGLVWQREDKQGQPIPDRIFRERLLVTQLGTAIDPDSDTATEGTLRETECVSPYWRRGGEIREVALVGYVFLRQGSSLDIQSIGTLFLGGDSRYGLGKVVPVKPEETDNVFGYMADLKQDEVFVRGKHLLAHTFPPPDTSSVPIQGAQERLVGWDKNSLHSAGLVPLWVPGSVCEEEKRFKICETGLWEICF
jgi:hypothetical protein